MWNADCLPSEVYSVALIWNKLDKPILHSSIDGQGTRIFKTMFVSLGYTHSTRLQPKIWINDRVENLDFVSALSFQ